MPEPKCPHCGVEMSLWEEPPMRFGDGLGWGTPYLFVCFNDECELYKSCGWKHIEESYAHRASYRCMNYPGSDVYECVPVFSDMGMRGQIVDDEAMAEQENLKEAIKRGFNLLADYYTTKDGPAIVQLLQDPLEPARVRLKAAEMIGDIGECEAIEPMRNLRFPNEILQKKVEEAIAKSTNAISPGNALSAQRSSSAGPAFASIAARKWPVNKLPTGFADDPSLTARPARLPAAVTWTLAPLLHHPTAAMDRCRGAFCFHGNYPNLLRFGCQHATIRVGRKGNIDE